MKKIQFPLVALGGLLLGILTHKSLISNPEPPQATNFSTVSQKEAHEMSVRHRLNAGYCLSGDCSNKEGIFDLSETTISGLESAMQDIKAKLGTAPSSYRCIFSENSKGETILLLVPLDKNRYETHGEPFLRKIHGTLPCPTLCDINKSKVVMGNKTNGEDCCN